MTKLASSWAVSVLLKLSKFEIAERRNARFLKFAAEARANVTEVQPDKVVELLRKGALLVDVREAEEFRRGHIPSAQNLSRGLLDIEIESRVPDLNAVIVCYCGAGNRSALAAESLQRMGYKGVKTIAGGLRAWLVAGLPVTCTVTGMDD